MNKSNIIMGTYLVSHKCYKKVSALRFSKHRKWYVQHLRIIAKKYSVSIINYLVASDGVYFICAVTDPIKISTMMQVMQSSVSKEFASKRGGESAMWRGRFSATFVHGDIWIRQCMLLLDLHMVATEQIIHPVEWKHSGWRELAGIRKRFKVISTVHALKAWGDTEDDENSMAEYIRAVETCCLNNSFGCLETWTHALTVGSAEWIRHVSVSIPKSFKSIDTLPCSASPLSCGDVKAVTLTVSQKRRRGYLDMISKNLNSIARDMRLPQA